MVKLEARLSADFLVSRLGLGPSIFFVEYFTNVSEPRSDVGAVETYIRHRLPGSSVKSWELEALLRDTGIARRALLTPVEIRI
jgi:hypothetical protein